MTSGIEYEKQLNPLYKFNREIKFILLSVLKLIICYI